MVEIETNFQKKRFVEAFFNESFHLKRFVK